MTHLYLQTAFLGDLLLAIPTLKQIRYWSPQSSLLLVCRKGYGPLMKELGVCDEVIEVDKSNKKKLGALLSDREFETVFCPHQSMTSHKVIKKIKAKKKLGYKKTWNSSYFDIRVERNLQWPEAIRQLQLLAPLSQGIEVNLEAFAQKPDEIPKWAEMNLGQLKWPESKLEKLAKDKTRGFQVDRPFVCIAPGSVWDTKRWVPDYFINAATSLVRKDYQVVVLGAPDERTLCEKIQKEIPNSFSLAGHLSVLESMMFIARAKGLICNDSGAMHMASVVNCPTVSIFGPTVQELGYKPWNPRAVVVERGDLLCRPCGQHGANHCPIGIHRCMKDVKPGQVLDQVFSLFG